MDLYKAVLSRYQQLRPLHRDLFLVFTIFSIIIVFLLFLSNVLPETITSVLGIIAYLLCLFFTIRAILRGRQEERVLQKNRKKDIGISVILLFAFVFVIRFLRKKLAILTQYFPFSLVSRRFGFHYDNKEINEACDLVVDESLKNQYFKIEKMDQDQHFFHLEGAFDTDGKKVNYKPLLNELEKKLSEGEVFIRSIDKSKYRISVSREAVKKYIA